MLQKPVQKNSKRELKVIMLGGYPVDENMPKGGIESATLGLSMGIVEQSNISLKIISLPKKDIKKDVLKTNNKYEILYLSNPYRYQILSALRFKKIIYEIKKFKPDICHLHGSGLINLFIILYLLLYKIPFVLTIHGIVSIERKNDFSKQRTLKNFIKMIIHSIVEYSIILLSKYIIVDTEYVAKKVPLTNHKKVFIVPQGINKEYINIRDIPINGYILSVGAISRRKGYEYCIQAIREIKKNYPSVKYVIIGGMSGREQSEYYKKLKNLIKKYDLQDTVQIYTNMSKEFIYKQMERAYIFILHSEEESQGIAFCEAMAAGKPVVATNVGGVPYVVKNGVTGFLSEYGNVKSFIENIIKLLENPQLRNDMSKKSKIAAKKYDWNQISANIINIYEGIIKE